MVPQQHFDDPTTRRDVGAKESVTGANRARWWGVPSYRVPMRRWHGNVHKQSYKLNEAQYATSCILTKHHDKLFSWIPFVYSTI